jgi:hypothetical protein
MKNRHSVEQIIKVYLLASVCMLLALLKIAWAQAIEHENRPVTVGLLKPSCEMWQFYLNVWTLVYVSLMRLAAVG